MPGCSLIALFLGLPKEVGAQEADNRPYAVFVNGYQNCCAWNMTDVTDELESQGVEIRYTPWNNFNDGGKDQRWVTTLLFLEMQPITSIISLIQTDH